MPTTYSKNKQAKILIDLLVSGRDLPSDFLESLQSWLIDDEGEQMKDEFLMDVFNDRISSSDSMEYALKLWPDMAGRVGLDAETARRMVAEVTETAQVAHIAEDVEIGPRTDSRSVETVVPARKKISFAKRILRYSAAAAVLLAAGITFYLTRPSDTQIAMRTITTGADTLSFVLPDGSKVSLRENTTLSYYDDFATNRTVTMDGEVLFDVVRDELHPFTVDNKDVQVVVLGTQFNVKDSEASNINEVAVITGQVRVTCGANSVILNTGERAIIDKINGSIETVGLKKSEMTKILGVDLEFREITLAEAFARIGKHFGVGMSVSHDVPWIDGIIMKLDYDAVLDDALFLLQASNPVFDYRIEGSTVVINKMEL